MDIEALREGLSLIGMAIVSLKQAKDLLPDSPKKDDATEALQQAERQLKIAEAQAAKGLGYQLCQCTFPPQIMLFTGDEDHFRCPECGHEIDTGVYGFAL